MSWRHFGVGDFFGILAVIIIGILVGYVGGDRRGWAAVWLLGMLVALIRTCWPVRHELWFWSAVVIFFTADVLAIALVDWSFAGDWNGHSFAGMAWLDFGAMLAIVYALYRWKYGTPVDPFEDDPAESPKYADRKLDL